MYIIMLWLFSYIAVLFWRSGFGGCEGHLAVSLQPGHQSLSRSLSLSTQFPSFFTKRYFVCRYLSLGNLRDANRLWDSVKQTLSDNFQELPDTPLLQFIKFLLLTYVNLVFSLSLHRRPVAFLVVF